MRTRTSVPGLLVLGCVIMTALPAVAQKRAPWDTFFTAQTGQQTTYMRNPFGGFCGVPVEIGDFDNDGFADYAVSPILTDSGPIFNRVDSGEIVIFKGNGTIGGIIDYASNPPGQPLLTIYGAQPFDYAGTELYSADVTGDGIVDLLIGASGADPNGKTVAGAAYIIPGGANFQGVVDLASPPPWIHVFQGIDAFDRFGFWVEAGDFDGDGIDDFLVSADDGNGPTNGEIDRGEAYCIYGGQTFPALVDMANPPATLQFTTIYGEDNNDQLGSSMHSRDIDGDGFEEIIVSAALNRAIAANTGAAFVGGDGPGNSRSRCGDTYIVWGRSGRPAVIDLSNPGPMLSAGDLTIIYGANSGDVLGEETSSGDLDGDGFPEVILGALTADGFNNAAPNAGDAVVIYGGPSLRGQVLDMATLPPGTTTIYGAAAGDIAADTLSSADVNMDGFDDLLVAVPSGDVTRFGSNVNAAGSVTVLYGGPVRWPSEVQLANMNTLTDIPSREAWGADAGDLTGYSMEAGDIDGDGFADVFPNAMRGDGFGNVLQDAGDVVIVSGQRFSRGIVTLANRPKLGTAVFFNLVGEPNDLYGVAFSGAAFPPQTVPTSADLLYLAPDGLFALTTQTPLPAFINFTGTTDGDGKAQYGLVLPNVPAFAGIRLYTAFVTIDPMALQVDTVSGTTSFVLEL